jgi:hypothetical protein
MNYLTLIQEISKLRYRNIPAAWSNVTADADLYYEIRDEIDNAIKDIFLDNFHDFREYKTTLATVDGQRSHVHNYGVIKRIQVLNSNSYYQDLKECHDYAGLEKTYSSSSESMPMYFVIYGGEIHLYPTPDAIYTLIIYYNTDKWAKSVGVVDQSSASSQNKLYITKTEGFAAGSTVLIEPNTPREETGVISSVTSNDYITLTSNLTYTHAVNSTVEYHKTSIDYELDEPNMPAKFHDVIKSKALMELYFSLGDGDSYGKYKKQYDKKYSAMLKEMRGSEINDIKFNYRSI